MYVKCVRDCDWVEYIKDRRKTRTRRLYAGQIFKTTKDWDENYAIYLDSPRGTWFLVRCSNLAVLTHKGRIEKI